MAYERERNELRRRYESDKKASENAANANMTAAGGHGWLIWLVLAVLAGAFFHLSLQQCRYDKQRRFLDDYNRGMCSICMSCFHVFMCMEE